MPTPLTYAACAEAGMTKRQCAAAMGRHMSSVNEAVRRHGYKFAPGDDVRTAALARWADPVKRAALVTSIKAVMSCPEQRSRMAEIRRAQMADPTRNVLAALTAAERLDYDTLKRKLRCTRDEALAAVGRHDLIRKGDKE